MTDLIESMAAILWQRHDEKNSISIACCHPGIATTWDMVCEQEKALFRERARTELGNFAGGFR